jgi:tetratricopeptide (TPR) repeat protein
MKPERIHYQAVLESLADGVEIDWAALETGAASDVERRRYRNLRLVARVAELHRTLAAEELGPAGPVDLDRQPAPAPTAWGHLDVGERIDGGAFGDVYLARDPHLNREVALKLLRLKTTTGQPGDHLLDEARTLARVRHPNVVTVHGADVRDGRAGLWMEFVHGRTLESWLQVHGALGTGEVTTLGVDLCRALAAVHAAGLVHGDVKAQNVMREEGGRIVLMDFGAGSAQGADARALAGTPLYLAPEVLAGEPATPRSDIYSLGVLLFHLLTRAYPYSAANLDGLRAAHADGSRVLLRDLRPDLPDPLVQAVQRALESDPARRFATAGEMEQGLSLALNPAPAGRISSSWIIAFAATLAAAVMLVAALIVALPSSRPSTLPRIESIAVLPFVAPGVNDRPALAGLAGDVVRELQRFDVVVKDATKAVSVAEDIDLQLDADAVVHTELRPGDRTVVNVSVRRAGGSTFFGREYDVYDAGLPAVARTIAADLARAIGASTRAGAPSPARPPNYAAYDAYQRGRVYAEERTEPALKRALASFDEAARLDPSYAEPWAGKADVYIALGVPAFGSLPPLEARRLAKESLLKALDLNPNLVEAHTSLAFTSFLHDWNWEAAQTRFDRALALNPQYALAHHWYAEYLNEMSRFDEALEEIKLAQQLNPLSLLIHRDVAWHYFCQRRYDEAIAQLRATLSLEPEYAPAITLLARSLAAIGQHTEALSELARTRGRISDISYLSFRGHIEAAAGQRRQAERTLAELQAPRREYVPPYYLALIYTALGRKTEALSELERAYLEQDSTLVSVNIDPRFDALRDTPRFKALIARMRFPAR